MTPAGTARAAGAAARDAAFWAQVAELRPRLRSDVEILVQDYRGQRWYLLHDRGAGRFIRFNTAAYEFLGRLDGDRSVQEILELANAAHVADPVLQPDDVLQILAQLHGAEVLRGGLPMAAQDVLNSYQRAQRFRRRRALSNPLALRIPLFDPDPVLDRLAGLARWLFSRAGLLLWSLVCGLAAVSAVAHAGELGAALAAKTLGTSEVLLFWLLFPLIKALHELGHGLAVKAWGGEVHEVGINLLVLMPVPYVDASAAWAFRDKRRRALVGAAGILVEMFVAALGLLVWVLVEPGWVRELALNAALIGGVSTLLFNGNPLLRFDGYYVLEDLIEVPNLATRSSRFYVYLIQRHLLGLADARPPATARGETGWFLVYGLAAPLYRLLVLMGIALYLASQYLVVGVVLAVWAVVMQVLKPLAAALRFVVADPRLAARRLRGFAVTALAAILGAGVLALPAPLVTRVQGVVWPDAAARVVSASDGFVVDVAAAPGAWVPADTVLLRLENPELQARHAVLEARLRELRDEQAAARQRSRVRAAMVADDIAAAEAELAQVMRRLAGLEVRSATAGRFHPVVPHALHGRYLRQGDVIAYVLAPDRPTVRAVVEQERIGLLRSHPTAVEVMLADRRGDPIPVRLLREIPAGSELLPSASLGAAGGGEVDIDSSDADGRTATDKVFQIELALPAGTPVSGVGGRAYVRLDHGTEPLWRQWMRGLRQLLLSRLQV